MPFSPSRPQWKSRMEGGIRIEEGKMRSSWGKEGMEWMDEVLGEVSFVWGDKVVKGMEKRGLRLVKRVKKRKVRRRLLRRCGEGGRRR